MGETVEQYMNRLTGYVSGKEPITVMRETPRLLAELIHAWPLEKLRRPPQPGKWSISEILAHLSETELAVSWRYRQVIEHSGSQVIAYDQDKWALWGDYPSCDPKDSLEQFRLLRERNLKLLSRLKPEQWELYGMHSERGKETIRRIAELAAGHDINHLQQVERIVASMEPK
jgi:hypothetical protein